MIIVNIPIDFSKNTGFRTYDDGPNSGQEFYDLVLKEKFAQALEQDVPIKIIFDGGEGYTSSFVNEAFRRLKDEFGTDTVWNRLILVSEESPRVIKKVKEAIYETE
jgi:hypothetical protein